MSADEIMALNLGRSCRIAAIAREMDTLWGLFLMRPSRLNSNDYLWMKEIESLAKLILEMDKEQSARVANGSAEPATKSPGIDGNVASGPAPSGTIPSPAIPLRTRPSTSAAIVTPQAFVTCTVRDQTL